MPRVDAWGPAPRPDVILLHAERHKPGDWLAREPQAIELREQLMMVGPEPALILGTFHPITALVKGAPVRWQFCYSGHRTTRRRDQLALPLEALQDWLMRPLDSNGRPVSRETAPGRQLPAHGGRR